MTSIKYIFIFLSFIFLVNCGETKTKDASKSIKIVTPKEVNNEDPTRVNIGITGNDMMQFSTKELRVPPGTNITLTLRHIGKMDLNVMGHNFVLLKPGTEIADFALQAANAGKPKDWIPNDGQGVIAHTEMIGGGQSTSISFTAPETGSYDFICSFPGHSGLMKGKFIVE
jgi:azurin